MSEARSSEASGEGRMESDKALDDILALEKMWKDKEGRVTFEDLGLKRSTVVRVRGNGLPIPERWRNYPGVKTLEEEMFEGLW